MNIRLRDLKFMGRENFIDKVVNDIFHGAMASRQKATVVEKINLQLQPRNWQEFNNLTV